MVKLRNPDGSFTISVLIPSFILFFLVMAVHSFVILGTCLLLCLWVLLGPRQVIQALSLNYMIICLNHEIFHTPSEIAFLRWLAPFIAGLRIMPVISSKSMNYILPLALFDLMITALAGAASPQFLVSLLKVTIFSWTVATMLAAYASIDEPDRERLKTWFLSLTIAVLLISLPTLPFSKAYKMKGFMGTFTHPQTFGAFLAPTTGYIFARFLLRQGPHPLWQWITGFLGLTMMILSRCRTSMLALILGVGIALLWGLCKRRSEEIGFTSGGRLLKITTSILLILVLVAVSSAFSKSVSGFWLKDAKGKDLEGAFYSSRGAGIERQWKRFLDQPLTGHGFGVDARRRGGPEAVLMGIPVAASTEKGFLPVAILEETGLAGAAFFAVFFVQLIRGAFRQKDIGFIAMFFCCIFINIGESVLFSVGFVGGYLWLLIGLCTAGDRGFRREA